MRPALLLSVAVAAIVGPRQLTAQVDPARYSGMHWRSIGPNRSGYVTSVAGVPGDPTIYYIGMPEGGVWKTTNGGTTWKPIFDAVNIPSVGALAVAPSAPSTIYVGTGNQSGWSFTPGNGVYKSTDAGATWTHIGLHGSMYVNNIVIDPRDANIVMVAALGSRPTDSPSTERGVYRSTDGGRTWQQVLGGAEGGASELVADAADPSVVYATIQRAVGAPAAPGASPTGVYKSVDEGLTWKPVNGQGLPDGTRGFALAVGGGTHGNRLYAEVRGGGRGGGPNVGGLYRSDNGGDSWFLGTHDIASAGGHIYGDPKNPDVVYLMGTSMYRSTDGGHHFISYMGAPSGDDIRQLWIDPTNSRRLLVGADQGPTISIDGGESWSLWNNIPNGQFYRVSTDNDFPYHVCGPQQDSGTACVLSRSDFGEIRPNDWAPVGGFENGFIVTDPLNSRWVYTQGWYHVLRRFDRLTGQVVVTYTPSTQDRFGGAPPLAFSPQDPHVLYMGAQYVLMSSDNAQTWAAISPDLTVRATGPDTSQAAASRRTGATAGGSISALAPSPVRGGHIWAGTGNGMVQLTRDGGRTWVNVTPPGIAGGSINIIDASHASAGTAFVALLSRDNRPHIYRTTTFGEKWDEIVNGITDSATVRVVREDPVDSMLLFAGTATSAWVSFDRGDHWQSLQVNLPHTVVSDMTVHGSDLVISTYGRGFWILDDLSPLRQARTAVAAITPAYLFRPDTASRWRWDNTQDTPLQVEVQAGENAPEGVIIDYYLKSPATGPVTLTFSDASGHPIIQYSNTPVLPDSSLLNVPAFWVKPPVVLPTAAGMHRVSWDMRYPDPPVLRYGYTGTLLDYVEFTLNWHAIPGLTPRVTPPGPMIVPGNYTVKLNVGGQSYTREVTVVNDPRIAVPQAALLAQLELQLRMMAGLRVSYDHFNQLLRLRAALATTVQQAVGTPSAAQLVAAAQSIDSAAVSLANSTLGMGGFGPSNRDLARRLTDMEMGDVQPSPSVVAAVDTNCRDLDTDLASLRRLQATNVAALNALLKQVNLPQLPALTITSRPACAAAS
jgi:photosystem II stability/assembly factor-like uncharacterized protein